jgi:hypothetical protein
VRRVADGRDRGHHGTGRDLAERDGIEELRIRHPVIGVHCVALHERDDHEAASVGERADLEGRPAQRAEPAGGGGARRHECQRRAVHAGRDARPALHRELDQAAAE